LDDAGLVGSGLLSRLGRGRSEAFDDAQSCAAETARSGELLFQGSEIFGLGFGRCEVGKRELAALTEPHAKAADLGWIIGLEVDGAAVFQSG